MADRPPILILAAGNSSRMRGRDKLLQEIDGVPLLRRTAKRALATGHKVYVTLPAAPHPRHGVLEDLDVTPVPVPDATLGMSFSLKGGVAHLPSGTEAALILLADMPDLTTGDMQSVIDARRAHPDALVWRGADGEGRPGHPVLIDARLFPEVGKLSGDQGAQPLISAAHPHVHLVTSVGNAARTDLDTPEAWDAWMQKRNRT